MRGKINPFTSSEFALLGFLYEKPTHGYDLHKLITDPDGVGLIWNVKMSNLYAYLDKLDKKGYIQGTMQPGDSRPTRMEYQITENGKIVFENWLGSIVQHPRDFRQEFMLRYFFMLKYQRENTLPYCKQQFEECTKWLENTKKLGIDYSNQDKFRNSILQFRINQIKSIVDWLEWILSQTI